MTEMEVEIQITASTPHFADNPDLDASVQGLKVKAMQSEWERDAIIEGSRTCYRVSGWDLFKAIEAAGNPHCINRNQIPALMTFRPSHCRVTAWTDNNPGKR
jgi:hypothetical protein